MRKSLNGILIKNSTLFTRSILDFSRLLITNFQYFGWLGKKKKGGLGSLFLSFSLFFLGKEINQSNLSLTLNLVKIKVNFKLKIILLYQILLSYVLLLIYFIFSQKNVVMVAQINLKNSRSCKVICLCI